jgi:hypothetical protein
MSAARTPRDEKGLRFRSKTKQFLSLNQNPYKPLFTSEEPGKDSHNNSVLSQYCSKEASPRSHNNNNNNNNSNIATLSFTNNNNNNNPLEEQRNEVFLMETSSSNHNKSLNQGCDSPNVPVMSANFLSIREWVALQSKIKDESALLNVGCSNTFFPKQQILNPLTLPLPFSSYAILSHNRARIQRELDQTTGEEA